VTRFTDEERQRIGEELHRAGRDQFTRFGLERTRIEDLTDEVGIGTSTFYQFFDSKGALYLSIIARERERVESDLDEALEGVTDARAEVRTTIEHFLTELSSNPLYYRLLMDDELQRLNERVDVEVLEAHHREGMATADDRVRRWVADETFRVDDPELLLAMFRLLGFTVAAETELFEPAGATDLYADAQALLVDAVVDGLFVEDA
jgi:AcrR family transcriptional regulator